MIQIKNLSKSFGSKLVLNNLNLSINEGLCVGIVGENGAGKSTLFHCIAGIETYNGSIESDVNPLKNHLGFLTTDPYFLNKITGREYLQLLCNARELTAPDFDQKNFFELPLDEYASTYSTGMKKKLALQGILFQKNKAFILDEPYNGIDIQSSMLVTEIIHRLKAAKNAVIISSHIFSTLKDTCDIIYVLKNGNLDESYLPEQFDQLENEMKNFTIGKSLDSLPI
jgi:ABC-2 type transport system ATP-binding protein